MKITFVCLGNICRSPMAQYLALQYIKENHIENIEIDSCGTSSYHQGEFMHIGTDRLLTKLNIKHNDFRSKPINKKIFESSDYILVMDDSNKRNVINKFGNDSKIKKMSDYCSLSYNEVPDPWYDNNFELVYQILINSIKNFFDQLINNK